jgi:hypothetical protein
MRQIAYIECHGLQYTDAVDCYTFIYKRNRNQTEEHSQECLCHRDRPFEFGVTP